MTTKLKLFLREPYRDGDGFTCQSVHQRNPLSCCNCNEYSPSCSEYRPPVQCCCYECIISKRRIHYKRLQFFNRLPNAEYHYRHNEKKQKVWNFKHADCALCQRNYHEYISNTEEYKNERYADKNLNEYHWADKMKEFANTVHDKSHRLETRFASTLIKAESKRSLIPETTFLPMKAPSYEMKDIHQSIKRPKRRFQCLYCDKSFGKSSHLRDHHRTHSGERPFACRYCGKAFSQFSNLRTHLRIHTGEKPFKCHICEKSFTQRVTLRSHLRTHTTKKLLKCMSE